MTQSSPPSHDGSDAIDNVCPDYQKLYFKDATQKRFTLFWQHLRFVLTNLYAEQHVVEYSFDQYQFGPMQADTSKRNKIRDPFEVCSAGGSPGFMPFAGENP